MRKPKIPAEKRTRPGYARTVAASEAVVDPEMAAAAPSTSSVDVSSSTWDPLRLSHLKPSLTVQDVQLASRQDLWHKFIVFGVDGIPKSDVLDAIVQLYGHEIVIPLLYRLENPQKATFIANCPVPVLERLVKQGLRISVNSQILAMDVILGFLGSQELDISPQKSISRALINRYDNTRKYLNLSNFQNDKAMDSVYCPLSSPKMLGCVMRCCKIRILGSGRDGKLSIRELNLSSNGLDGMTTTEKFFNYHLTKIDLSHNRINDLNGLRYFADFKITELRLDGNPLCANYTTAEDYVKSVKLVFPHVQRLDGVMIGVERKFIPVLQTNFIGDSSRLNLVKQFIGHYFTYYDQDDRIVLNGIYDDDALFSSTLGSITNANHRQMTKAFASNRNLLKFVDYAKCHEFVLRGPEKIIAALRRQPPTHHDYRKFNIDIMHSGEIYVVVAIQGFFCYKEFSTIPLFFNRTFVLVDAGDNEYCIVNDQYHIQSLTPGMKLPDKDTKIGGQIVAPKIKPKIFGPSERHQLMFFFHERTTMNENYCRRYLEDANWNIRAALSSFIKAYTVNDVPPEAFRTDESS